MTTPLSAAVVSGAVRNVTNSHSTSHMMGKASQSVPGTARALAAPGQGDPSPVDAGCRLVSGTQRDMQHVSWLSGCQGFRWKKIKRVEYKKHLSVKALAHQDTFVWM